MLQASTSVHLRSAWAQDMMQRPVIFVTMVTYSLLTCNWSFNHATLRLTTQIGARNIGASARTTTCVGMKIESSAK